MNTENYSQASEDLMSYVQSFSEGAREFFEHFSVNNTRQGYALRSILKPAGYSIHPPCLSSKHALAGYSYLFIWGLLRKKR